MTFNAVKSSAAAVSWKSTGNIQKTLAGCVEKHGVGLHSGRSTKVKLWPELAKKGRYFQVGSSVIETSINFVKESPLCTSLCKDGVMVTTVEHLLSALEATGVDNCRIEINPTNRNDPVVETGNIQKTLAGCVEKHGVGLHSGRSTKVKLWPELAKKGRYFQVGSSVIETSINFVKESPLCTSLCKDGVMVTTVEHLLSALEATGVDNCRIEINPTNRNDPVVEVPILDGSATEWVEAIEKAGLEDATDEQGNSCEKMAPFVNGPIHLRRNDSFIAAFPSEEVHITYGINFPKVPTIGCQWFFSRIFNSSFYATDIAPARTFCIYDEVEKMRELGLIKGGSLENAIVCSALKGWLNSPLRFHDEPCRHKVLDLIGDLSIFAKSGNQGLPIAHIVAYKAGHALHADFVRHLS